MKTIKQKIEEIKNDMTTTAMDMSLKLDAKTMMQLHSYGKANNIDQISNEFFIYLLRAGMEGKK